VSKSPLYLLKLLAPVLYTGEGHPSSEYFDMHASKRRKRKIGRDHKPLESRLRELARQQGVLQLDDGASAACRRC